MIRQGSNREITSGPEPVFHALHSLVGGSFFM